MKTLALLLAVLFLVPAAHAQEAEAPEGAIIDIVEMSGFSIYSLSPGLQKELNSLVDAPVNRERLNQLVSRIEGEQPEMVAAVRSVVQPDGKARVIFLVARISERSDLSENINARYVVESVEIEGAASDVSQQLRDDLQQLVGKRLDSDEADKLKSRLESELPGRDIARRISKGTQPGTIRVVFEVVETPWIPFIPTRSKLVYHATEGWSGVLDIPMSFPRNRYRFTVGVVMDNRDDLLEEYSGFRVGFESRALGTEKLGARLEFSRFNQTWQDSTLTALGLNPAIPEAYRARWTFEPTATFAINPSLRVDAGVSLSEVESLMHSPNSQTANAWVFGIGADHNWRMSGDVRQKVEASYRLRAAVDGLDSDLSYKRHFGQGRYQYDYGRSTAIASASFGYISGAAPLFERFSLGDTTTLRGWNKYDLAPAGGDRMFHSSVEYRYSYIAAFFDTGSVWDRGSESKIRYSTGFGVHSDNFFLTIGFPLNADDTSATFMAGVRF